MNLREIFSIKGCDQLDVYYSEDVTKSLSLENNKIKNFELSSSSGAGIRAIVRGKVGFSYTTNLQKLKETAKQAIKLAKFSNQQLKLKSFSRYKKPSGLFDREILDIDDKKLVKSSTDAIAFVKKNNAILTGGSISLTKGKTIYANSEGSDLEEESSFFLNEIDVNYKGIEAFWSEGKRKYTDNSLVLAKEAIKLAKQMNVKGKVITGKHDVIFHPFALQQILKYGLYPSLNSDSVQKGKSKLVGKLGEKIFDSKLTIYDNGVLESGLGSETFDGDGVPSQNTLLVKNGVIKEFLYDLIRAQKENKESTGNAGRDFSTLPSVSVSNFQIMPGRTKDVISEIDKGLWLYYPLSAHSINPITGDFSVGSMMSFWVEKGKVKFTPKNVMISGNIFDLFKNIKLIGKDVMRIGSLVSPSIVAETQIIGE